MGAQPRCLGVDGVPRGCRDSSFGIKGKGMEEELEIKFLPVVHRSGIITIPLSHL